MSRNERPFEYCRFLKHQSYQVPSKNFPIWANIKWIFPKMTLIQLRPRICEGLDFRPWTLDKKWMDMVLGMLKSANAWRYACFCQIKVNERESFSPRSLEAPQPQFWGKWAGPDHLTSQKCLGSVLCHGALVWTLKGNSRHFDQSTTILDGRIFLKFRARAKVLPFQRQFVFRLLGEIFQVLWSQKRIELEELNLGSTDLGVNKSEMPGRSSWAPVFKSLSAILKEEPVADVGYVL